jgi:S1-C subfamily serine protease
VIAGIRALLGLLTLPLVAFEPIQVCAQDSPSELVAPSLVYLKLEFTPTKGPSSGVPETEQTTGFLVSDDGFILTSYHLLEKVDEKGGADTVRVSASLGDPQAPAVTAAIVNGLKPLDVLLLKIRTTKPLQHLTLGTAEGLRVGDAIYTSGFHDTEPFSEQGTLSNTYGPLGIGYLWTLNMAVAAGQSGSPVYLSDGKVVGILKGENMGAASVGYMVPIDFADSLIAHLRLRELNDEFLALSKEIGWKQGDAMIEPLAPRLSKVEKGMQDVGKNFNWTGEERDGILTIAYHKLIAGSPIIKSVRVTVIPIVTTVSTSEANRSNSLILDTNPRSVQQTSDRDGRVAVDILKAINARLDSTGDNIAIMKVLAVIVATTDDGAQMDPASIWIDTKRYAKQ